MIESQNTAPPLTKNPHGYRNSIIEIMNKPNWLGKKPSEQKARDRVANQLIKQRRDPVGKAILEEQRMTLRKTEAELESQRELSLLDSLTGLYNRRFLNGDPKTGRVGILESAFKDAQRGDDPLSILMIDIDHFKKNINDIYGHLSGDRVLEEVARVIKTHLRHSDFGVRFGGEEFVVILPVTDVKGGEDVAEILRKAIASLTFNEKNMPKNLTVSVGVASYVPNQSIIIHDQNILIYAADKAMYLAKQNGRNQTWTAGEDKSETKLVYHQSL